MTAGNGGSTGRKPRLELTWIGKDERPRLEPRILLPQAELSYAKGKPGDAGIHDNILIHGDNLLALKALEQEFAGRVKCIYIDPPYNTGSAFPSYDDGLEHSLWLTLMRDRVEALHRLLADDGLFFCQIDDNEIAYLTVMLDEVFGRANRVNIVAVKMSESTGVKMSHARKRMPKQKEFVLVYKKGGVPDLTPIRVNLEKWNTEYKEILLNISEEKLAEIKDLIDEEDHDAASVESANALIRNAKIMSLSAYFKSKDIASERQEQFRWENAWRIVQAVGAGSIKERAKDARIADQDLGAVLSAQRKLYLFKTAFDETSRDPRIRIIFADKYLQTNPGDFWTDIKTTGGVGQEGGVMFPKGKKPEALIARILGTATNPGDLVLDSFAGSGTTGAVAHKMGRRWIMVELGDHATTHVVPRLKKVIDGTDPGGVTEVTGWKGGGGFRFYKLAPSLIEEDQFGQKIISKQYRPEMLAEAMCKHMGYTYDPSRDPALYWQQGYGTERDFIFTTTQSLTHDALKALSLEVGPDRHLLICCKAFRARLADFPNLTVKKIPQAVLDNCEWGRDDYSFSIAKPREDAAADPDDGPDDNGGGNGGEAAPRRRGRRAATTAEPAAETRAAPVKKAPLKMDGTTRQPRVRMATSTQSTPRPAVSKLVAQAARPTPDAGVTATRRPAARTKAAATNKAAKAGKTKPPAKPKTRQASDARQGRLL